MAPKIPEKQQQHNQREQSKQQQPLNNNSVVIKHSNPFHISAYTLCHNKRLKQKRSKYAEYLRNAHRRNNQRLIPEQQHSNSIINNNQNYNHKNHKTELRRRKLSLLQADVTIDLLSDNEEEENNKYNQNVKNKPSVIVYPGRMCLERAALLGLMPVDRTKLSKLSTPPSIQPAQPSLVPLIKIKDQQLATNNSTNIPPTQNCVQQQQQSLTQPLLMVPEQQLSLPTKQTQPRKRKSKPQKRRSLTVTATKIPVLLNTETIVLSDDSSDGLTQTVLRSNYQNNYRQEPTPTPELSVTCPTSSQIPCLPQQLQPTSMQVDEEVTISLVPRPLTATNYASRSSSASSSNLQNGSTSNSTSSSSSVLTTTSQELFPMLPDETTVHTVIANRIYELSLTKLREGLASCGIPEFADGQQRISPQRRKGMLQQQPPLVSPPQAPISLKLSSDLSISLISDDDEDEAARQRNRHHEPILSPAFLQKLPVNVSIAPVPMGPPPPTNHTAEPRKLKLG